MKTFSCFASAIVAGLASAEDWPSIDLTMFEEKTFQNKVDHFNYLNNSEYSQRYWVSDQYWDGSGPIFIYICGEYRCTVPDTRLYPFMVGADHQARFMVLEHRFYGDSQPFDSWDLENLGFLNSEQALADLAYFIGEMNPDQANEVLVIGGSYPGALSAWFRSRYPHLTVGSWASSGVVQPVIDMWQFDEQVYTSSEKSGAFCPTMIQSNMEYVTAQGVLREAGATDTVIDETLQGTGSEGMRTDDWMFFYADIFVESVQYGNRTKMCDLLQTNQSASQDSIVETMTSFGHTVTNVNPGDYDTRVIAETTVDPMSSARPWTFQYCSEYGFFQIPSKKNVMRSTMLVESYWTAMCARSFGEGMPAMPQAKETTIDQGGWDIKATNIFFTNGTEDPWRWVTQQVTNDGLNQVARTANCTNCGHCVELYTPTDDDAPELKEIRSEIASWVNGLLGNKKQPVEFLQ